MAALQQPTPLSYSEASLKEKEAYVGTALDEKELAFDPDKSSSDASNDEDEGPIFVNGEPSSTAGEMFLSTLSTSETMTTLRSPSAPSSWAP